ncbi:MAG: metal-dependent transcriptional regulator [Bacillota bacterium]|jgi:DtxR family Mn-dependent transcriptional regulator
MSIKESGENYLETILLLQKRKDHVRSIDVANELSYTKASISRAMGILKKKHYITIDASGQILFTDKGYKKALEIYERHCLITQFLIETLDLDPETADADACRMEHIISEETFQKIKDFLNKKI